MSIDAVQRKEAVNPEKSFIVQAPAGSGKTEILTQRYLCLLNRVKAPEQIVALTFTRKAAGEMRARILAALQQAEAKTPITSEHQAKTREFALSALQQDHLWNWQLLQQPSRLRIITIDSLCQMLNQAIPLQEKQIAFAAISDNPAKHYEAAAKACLEYALEQPSWQPALKIILMHLDNRQDRLLSLFGNLLATRDHWLGPLFNARMQEKNQCEKALQTMEKHALKRLHESLPETIANDLITLGSHMASLENKPDSLRFVLRNYLDFHTLDKSGAKALAALLLTSTNTFRVAFDHHVGLKKDSCPPGEYEILKQKSKNILQNLQDYPDFLEALLLVRDLPDPFYDANQWEVLHALFALLPLLVSHLQLRFAEQNEVDFTAISQQALFALGTEEEPTDLALYMDNIIQHLLIDEFQDTSIAQFQLISRLVQGWENGDGRTLFVVGDPMQSIYRFRQAEVGLFLKARQQGIGPVTLTPLNLCCNFRSTPNLVNWINQQFQSVFPASEDMESGAICFHASTAVKPTEETSRIEAWQFETNQAEAQWMTQLIQDLLTNHPEYSIAILARSRNQLKQIIQHLRAEAIPFQGVDISLLSKLPHLRDIWSLTKTLLMPGNRLAFMELLRSPFCGLSMQDLHVLANINKNQSIYSILNKPESRTLLSQEGQIRVAYVMHTIQQALHHRHQTSLASQVLATFRSLHGESMLDSHQKADLEQFYQLLEQYEEAGQLPDIQAFEKALETLYSLQTTKARLQIMTIHKSKGLEFDCVILPGLGTVSNNTDKPLLRWLSLPANTGEEITLVSPVKGADQEACALYDYIGKLDEQKSAYERQRLLYVAVTRAKKQLYLCSTEKFRQKSFRDLLKQVDFLSAKLDATTTDTAVSLPPLYQLPLHYYHTIPAINRETSNHVCMQTGSTLPRLAGVICHQLLQWICDNHPPSLNAVPPDLIRHFLQAVHINSTEESLLIEMIQQQLRQIFQSDRGRWIMQPHLEAKNEYALLVTVREKVVNRIIDRTFIHEGIRWIIDFKTGKEDNTSQIQHRQQLNEYASFLATRESRPISCGLYYLTSDHFESWVYEKSDREICDEVMELIEEH